MYKNVGWKYKFVLGLPSSASQDLSRHDQAAVATREESMDADNLLQEMEKFGDLQFLAMRDEYMDLTVKTFQWLRYTYATTDAEYFMLHDDDSCVVPKRLNTNLNRYYDSVSNGSATIEYKPGVSWQHLALNSSIPDNPKHAKKAKTAKTAKTARKPHRDALRNSIFRLQSLTDTRPILGVRPQHPNTRHLLWFGGYLFKGTEYQSMRGAANTTCPFFSGTAGSLMNRALVSYLVEHEWVQTLFFLRYGSASEDGNLGKAIAKLMIKNGVKHKLS